MLSKINFLTALSALVLFFLPWVDLRCSGKSLITQSGAQMIVGKGSSSLTKEYENDSPRPPQYDKEASHYAPILGVALLAVICAVVAAFFSLFGKLKRPLPEALCALALVLICVQIFAGFPLKKGLESPTWYPPNGQTRYDPSAGYDPGLASAVALMNFEIRYLPGLYLELFALAIPTLLLVNRSLDALRKTTPGA